MQRASVLQLKIARKLCYSFSVALTLALLSFCLMACSLASDCGATVLNSACQSSSRPTTASSSTPTVRSTTAPTATPTFMPSPTPTPGVAPSQAPTSTAFPELPDQQVVTNTIQHYENLVVVDGADRKAYNLLSADLQAREAYDDFIKNANYTLKKGCWHFQVHNQNGLFVINSIGLYPTGSQNQ